MNCCTLIYKYTISKIQEANKVLLEITYIHDHTQTDPIIVSNTTILINKIILVSSLKVNSNYYAQETFASLSWKAAPEVMCAQQTFIISVLSAWDATLQS